MSHCSSCNTDTCPYINIALTDCVTESASIPLSFVEDIVTTPVLSTIVKDNDNLNCSWECWMLHSIMPSLVPGMCKV